MTCHNITCKPTPGSPLPLFILQEIKGGGVKGWEKSLQKNNLFARVGAYCSHTVVLLYVHTSRLHL